MLHLGQNVKLLEGNKRGEVMVYSHNVNIHVVTHGKIFLVKLLYFCCSFYTILRVSAGIHSLWRSESRPLLQMGNKQKLDKNRNKKADHVRRPSRKCRFKLALKWTYYPRIAGALVECGAKAFLHRWSYKSSTFKRSLTLVTLRDGHANNLWRAASLRQRPAVVRSLRRGKGSWWEGRAVMAFFYRRPGRLPQRRGRMTWPDRSVYTCTFRTLHISRRNRQAR